MKRYAFLVIAAAVTAVASCFGAYQAVIYQTPEVIVPQVEWREELKVITIEEGKAVSEYALTLSKIDTWQSMEWHVHLAKKTLLPVRLFEYVGSQPTGHYKTFTGDTDDPTTKR